jgi:hypothetical protein
MSILRILKQEFIRGNITKDQYEILKENIADVLKDLISKKTDANTKDKKQQKKDNMVIQYYTKFYYMKLSF